MRLKRSAAKRHFTLLPRRDTTLVSAAIKLPNLTGKRTSKLIAWGIAKICRHAYTPALT